MKKYLVALMLLAVAGAPFLASAQSLTDLANQVNQLSYQINNFIQASQGKVLGVYFSNVADLSASLAPTSPVAGQVRINASGADTANVYLAVYRFHSANASSTIKALTFKIVNNLGNNWTSSVNNWTSYIKNLRLSNNGNTYAGISSVSDGTVTFSNLNIPLPKDLNSDWSLKADITASSSSFSVSPILDVSRTVAVDANYNTPTYGGAQISTLSSGVDVAGNTITFVPNTTATLAVSGLSTNSTAINNGPNPVVAYDTSYSFTLINTGYVNAFVSQNVATSLTSASSNSNSPLISLTSPSLSGDTSSVYVIPSGGSRNFNARGIIRNDIGTAQWQKITAINYGSSSNAPTGSEITTGLDALSLVKTFSINNVSGTCGPTNGSTTPSQPTTGLCSSGTMGNMMTTPTGWSWSCNGSSPSSIALCQATKAVQVTPFIKVNTPANNILGGSANISWTSSPDVKDVSIIWSKLGSAGTAGAAEKTGWVTKPMETSWNATADSQTYHGVANTGSYPWFVSTWLHPGSYMVQVFKTDSSLGGTGATSLMGGSGQFTISTTTQANASSLDQMANILGSLQAILNALR